MEDNSEIPMSKLLEDSKDTMNIWDLYAGNRVATGIKVYNAVVLALLIISAILLFVVFFRAPGIISTESLSAGGDFFTLPDNQIRDSHSVHPTYKTSYSYHPEPWDYWNPPRCASKWEEKNNKPGYWDQKYNRK